MSHKCSRLRGRKNHLGVCFGESGLLHALGQKLDFLFATLTLGLFRLVLAVGHLDRGLHRTPHCVLDQKLIVILLIPLLVLGLFERLEFMKSASNLRQLFNIDIKKNLKITIRLSSFI
jgi:hypothetical protein